MSDIERLSSMAALIAKLESENMRLRCELAFLKTHTSIAQGMRGETLIAKAIDGSVTSYAEGYDVLTTDGRRIEVKFSKLNQPVKHVSTKRWNWSKPLGSMDRGKEYEYLLLIGEKDERYSHDSIDASPYVYFLIPNKSVSRLMDKGSTVGGMIQVTTNLEKLRQKKVPPEILQYQCNEETVTALLSTATAV
ncbi:MAG: hypothetical protein HZC43_06870 [Nitrosomonadales bacterium]|nr:hypothetical protein [Nitrosomonadales bacterium]